MIPPLTSGDLRQCLPVIPKSGPSEIIAATITHAPFWPDVVVLRLHDNMRLESAIDPVASKRFADWLLTVGNGKANTANGMTDLPPELLLPPGSTRSSLVSLIYPDIEHLPPTDLVVLAHYFAARVILAPHNHSVDLVNATVLGLLQGPAVSLWSADLAVDEDGRPTSLPQEYLHAFEPAGFPLHHLTIKVGAPLVLLRNIAPSAGLCNGTRMLLLHAGQHVLRCQVLSGSALGSAVLIPRIRLTSAPSARFPYVLHRTQFPVRLAFAMTINKAQGQSLRYAGLDLSIPCFTHGQLYVGLSRATAPDSIKILVGDEGVARGSVANVVFQEVFSVPHQRGSGNGEELPDASAVLLDGIGRSGNREDLPDASAFCRTD